MGWDSGGDSLELLHLVSRKSGIGSQETLYVNSWQFLLSLQSVQLQQRGKVSGAPIMSFWRGKGAGNPPSLVTESGTEVGQHFQVSTKALAWGGRPQSTKSPTCTQAHALTHTHIAH